MADMRPRLGTGRDGTTSAADLCRTKAAQRGVVGFLKLFRSKARSRIAAIFDVVVATRDLKRPTETPRLRRRSSGAFLASQRTGVFLSIPTPSCRRKRSIASTRQG